MSPQRTLVSSRFVFLSIFAIFIAGAALFGASLMTVHGRAALGLHRPHPWFPSLWRYAHELLRWLVLFVRGWWRGLVPRLDLRVALAAACFRGVDLAVDWSARRS